MNHVSCLVSIQSKIKLLTGSEKKVADYVLENYMEVLDYTVTELAEKAKVSDATVVRFCRSVGYKGYQDLKINLAQDAIVPYKHLNTSLEKEDTPSQIARKVIRSEIETLEETVNILNMRELELAAKAIKEANRVVFFGAGG
ncbi:MAG: MurR/RpiR family transcriptional regulator, partial [Lachnospiraceae bacterium]|nr:MurR/RpiR family transcriptional regulator [Lachnospiraceae bacterium]